MGMCLALLAVPLPPTERAVGPVSRPAHDATSPLKAMTDITALILDDHEWLRRRFAALDDVREAADLQAVWQPLATRLDTHADAEEKIFYPQLRRRADPGGEETRDAIRDHNKIRRAIADAARQAVGSDAWFEAVGRARAENSDHLKEEEDEVLPDFRKHANLELRERLGVEWMRFKAAHPAGQGVSGDTVDVEGYMKRTEP
jgi:hypothetical protein